MSKTEEIFRANSFVGEIWSSVTWTTSKNTAGKQVCYFLPVSYCSERVYRNFGRKKQNDQASKEAKCGLRVWPQTNKLNKNIIIKKISQILERAQTKNRGPFEARKLKMGSPILHTPYTHKDHYCTRNLRGDSSTLGFNQHKIAVAIYRN